ncbi:MAG TPA: FAD-dependent oxidoreductase [Candidatus Paceibacterota bacterium]|nr:FAD-dependent oxidoreductase [Candidatus Paceibacterota bacterium]
MYDIIIIGGGPAACSAGVYSARKKLKTLVVAQELGGQSSVSPEIQNWLGEPSISGHDLNKKFTDHLRSYEGENLTIKKRLVTKVENTAGNFRVKTESGESFEAKTVLLATGGSRRKLDIKGADIFEHKGLTYCASCDGPLFSGQEVVVIGGGNAGFGTAGQLLAYCPKVTLLEMAPTFKAETVTIEKLKGNPNFQAISNVELLEIKGDPTKTAGQVNFVASIVYKNKETGEVVELPTTGIFVEIGFAPNNGIVKELIDLNPAGYVIVNHQTQETSLKGIWAAGDCSDVRYHQNGIAFGDAIKAVENIYEFLKAK